MLRAFELLDAAAGWSDGMAEAARWLGGCDESTADLEALVLLGAARAARHAGLPAQAGELLDNGASVAGDPVIRRLLNRERERWSWARSSGPFLRSAAQAGSTGT